MNSSYCIPESHICRIFCSEKKLIKICGGFFLIVFLSSFLLKAEGETKAPRVDAQGNVLIPAAPIPSPEVATVQASVSQLSTEVSQLQVQVNRITTSETALDACCSTINGKLDVLLLDSQSILDNLSVSVDVATIESKLDVLLESNSIIESMIDDINVSVDMTTLESKIDILLEDSQSILDNLSVVVDVATIESKLDVLLESNSVIESMIDDINVSVDVTTLESKVDLLLDDVSVVESLIVEGSACAAQSLSTEDVSGGLIVLSHPGNYCLAEDLVATLSLVSPSITLCLNNRTITGAIGVYGSYAQVKNGYIRPPADSFGLMIAPSAAYTVLSDVSISCDEEASGTALIIAAPRCGVYKSLCEGGGTGGSALALYGADVHVEDVHVSSYTVGGSHGIVCYSPVSRVVIKRCEIDGRDSLGIPGNGSGIFIAPGCSSVEVRDCTLARTANFAIEDNHVDQYDVGLYSSVIYNNFAYDSANNSAAYQIRNKKSMGQSYGVDLISGSPGLYANVYIP